MGLASVPFPKFVPVSVREPPKVAIDVGERDTRVGAEYVNENVTKVLYFKCPYELTFVSVISTL